MGLAFVVAIGVFILQLGRHAAFAAQVQTHAPIQIAVGFLAAHAAGHEFIYPSLELLLLH
jgi:hypothetical protein